MADPVDDPIMVFVDQCNAENDGGDAKLENEKDWNATDANTKRGVFKKRYTRSDSDNSDENQAAIEDDFIKNLVDKEFDLERCLTNFKENMAPDEKIVTAANENVGDAASNRTKSESSINLKKTQDKDVFSEIIIDDLKKENRDLKFALVSRNQRLEDAANKVTELVEQNTYLSQKVERAALDYSKQAEELVQLQKDYEKQVHDLNKRLSQLQEQRSLESTALDSSGAMLQATIHDLTDRLKKSEDANNNLQTYIDQLKKSYQAVFGNSSQSSAS